MSVFAFGLRGALPTFFSRRSRRSRLSYVVFSCLLVVRSTYYTRSFTHVYTVGFLRLCSFRTDLSVYIFSVFS